MNKLGQRRLAAAAAHRCCPLPALFGNFWTGRDISDFSDLGDTLAVSGPVSGSGGLTKSGAGTLVLSAGNCYTGGTTISDDTTGSVMGSITDNATLLLNFSGNQPVDNSVSGSGKAW